MYYYRLSTVYLLNPKRRKFDKLMDGLEMYLKEIITRRNELRAKTPELEPEADIREIWLHCWEQGRIQPPGSCYTPSTCLHVHQAPRGITKC